MKNVGRCKRKKRNTQRLEGPDPKSRIHWVWSQRRDQFNRYPLLQTFWFLRGCQCVNFMNDRIKAFITARSAKCSRKRFPLPSFGAGEKPLA